MILLMTQDRHYSDSDNALKQVTARGGTPLDICSEEDKTSNFVGLPTLRVPTVVDALQGIVNIVPLQLLSYHIGNLFSIENLLLKKLLLEELIQIVHVI